MLDFGFYNMDCMIGMKEFPDKYFDLAIVDPVYGDVTKGGYMTNIESTQKLAKVRKYHTSLWNQKKTGEEYFKELFRVSKNQVIWGGNYFSDHLHSSQCWIVWDKNNTGRFADAELAWTSFNTAVRIFKYTWNGMIQEQGVEHEYRIHPTQKPIKLYEWIISKYANPGDIILDTHVGSASSLIACRNTNHKYVGFEIDEEYYRQAKKRLDQASAQMNIFDLLEETS